MASTHTCTAVSKPKVSSVADRSLSMVLGTPTTATPSAASRAATPSVSSPPMATSASIPWSASVARTASAPPSILYGLVRDEPRIVPPRGSVPRNDSTRGARRRRRPRRASRRGSRRARRRSTRSPLRTTARMTALSPGQSPPPGEHRHLHGRDVTDQPRPRSRPRSAPTARSPVRVRPMSVVIAIDAGTTGVRSFAVRADGHDRRATPTASSPSTSRPPGLVEHDADEIWAAIRADAGRARRHGSTARPSRPSASPTSARRPWSGTAGPGEPRHRAIVWQDRRTADAVRGARRRGPPRPRAPHDRARARPLLLGHQARVAAAPRAASRPGPTWRSGRSTRWLLWKLTGGPEGGVHATEPSNASRTMLFDISDPGLVRRADRPLRRAGLVPARGAPVGRALRRHRRGHAAAGGVPVGGIARRPAGGAVRPGLLRRPGMTKNTYGTGSFVLMNVGVRVPRARSRAC